MMKAGEIPEGREERRMNRKRPADLNPGKLNGVRLQLLKAPGEFTMDEVREKWNLTPREEKALRLRTEEKDGKLFYKEKEVKRKPRLLPGFFGGFADRKDKDKSKQNGLDLGEEVEVPDFLEEFIPADEKLTGYLPRKIGEQMDLEILAQAFRNKLNVLIVGESGTGKNHAVAAMCSALNLPHKRINLNGGATVEDLVGSRELVDGETVWRDGIVTQFCRFGGAVVLDEVNTADPEILFILHGLLDDARTLTLTQKGQGGEVVKACDNFMVVGTMNPLTYEGTRRLNPAFLDRFGIVLFYDWDLEIEKKLIDDPKLTEFAGKVRELYRSRQISTPVTTRTLLHFQKCEKMYGRETAIELMRTRFPAEEAQAVGNYLRLLYASPVTGREENK